MSLDETLLKLNTLKDSFKGEVHSEIYLLFYLLEIYLYLLENIS